MSNSRVFLAAGASLLLTCAFVAMVCSEGEVVLESDAQLAERKMKAEARIDEMNALQEVIHKAMKNPTPENIQAAMDAQKQLSGGALPQMPAAAPAAMPEVQEEAKVPTSHTAATTHELEKKEKSGVHRISQLEQMKAVVRKAEENPTPENIQAAMAAQRHLEERPASQPTIVSDASEVANMIKTQMQAHTAPAAAVAPAKAESKPASKPESDAVLKSQKANAQ